MTFSGMREFVELLEEKGELTRITEPVSAQLELTEIADRMMKQPGGGKGLLFENVSYLPIGEKKERPSPFPISMNVYGSWRRMEYALRVEHIHEITERIAKFTNPQAPQSFWDKIKRIPDLAELASITPTMKSSGPCQDVTIQDNDLSQLPIPLCWPEDGGPFITFGNVVTKDPDTGIRNVGLYRLHVYDKNTTGMHWQVHKVGSKHYQLYKKHKKRIPVAVYLGGDPVYTYAASAPLPPGIDEFLFAGFIRKKGVPLVKCKTIDMEVPADADFVIEGYVDPTEELAAEGPFGDHTGYYSLADLYPKFHVTQITHRRDAVYPHTIVGPPPMEDAYIGKATERLFLPLIKTAVPEIVDWNLPVEGVFHNIAIVSIKKEFPHHAKKVMHTLWGTGQLMFTKCAIIVDEDVNVHDMKEVTWRVTANIDPKRDILFSEGPADSLDHATPWANYGSKIGIDATRKWKEEGFDREWPEVIRMSPEIKEKVNLLWPKLKL